MQMHEVYNPTPFKAGLGFCQDKAGENLAVAVLKATFTFSDMGVLAVPPRDVMVPVCMADRYYDQPDNSSLMTATDIVPEKDGTDVAVNGHAYTGGETRVEAGFVVRDLSKLIVVSGARQWRRGMLGARISDPAPAARVALRYERAYGGKRLDPKHGPCAYAPNPVGVGFGATGQDGEALPELEYPGYLISAPDQQPPPAGLGFVAPGWKQRWYFAGTFDDDWRKNRCPVLPEDFDPKYYNAVAQDQVARPKLEGGERLKLLRLHPRQLGIELELPRLRFQVTFRVKDREETVPLAADTLLIEPDESRFSLAFRAVCAIGNDMRFVKSIHFRPA